MTPEQLYRRDLRRKGYSLKRSQIRKLTEHHSWEQAHRLIGNGRIELPKTKPLTVNEQRRLQIYTIMEEVHSSKPVEQTPKQENTSHVASEIEAWKELRSRLTKLEITHLERSAGCNGEQISEATFILTVPADIPGQPALTFEFDDMALESIVGSEVLAPDLLGNLDLYAQLAYNRITDEKTGLRSRLLT